MTTQNVYVVRAVELTGRVWNYEFSSELEALRKVREFKDSGGFIIQQTTYQKELV
jgi:threonyl-tRNA synthetase